MSGCSDTFALLALILCAISLHRIARALEKRP
jgi:hypothetical protein